MLALKVLAAPNLFDVIHRRVSKSIKPADRTVAGINKYGLFIENPTIRVNNETVTDRLIFIRRDYFGGPSWT